MHAEMTVDSTVNLAATRSQTLKVTALQVIKVYYYFPNENGSTAEARMLILGICELLRCTVYNDCSTARSRPQRTTILEGIGGDAASSPLEICLRKHLFYVEKCCRSPYEIACYPKHSRVPSGACRRGSRTCSHPELRKPSTCL